MKCLTKTLRLAFSLTSQQRHFSDQTPPCTDAVNQLNFLYAPFAYLQRGQFVFLQERKCLASRFPHIDDALVETVTECELLQATGQAHVLEALVETVTECELLQATGQAHVLHALVETVTECELLQATGQAHVLQTGAGDQELTTTRPNACQVKKLEPSKKKEAFPVKVRVWCCPFYNL